MKPEDNGTRLTEALRIFSEWSSSDEPEEPETLLERFPHLRDLLEPMLMPEDPDSCGEDELPTMGGYRMIRVLGRGGMGVVYEAEQLDLRRRVVLKLLPGRFSRDPEARVRLRREAWTAARLRHPGIVRVIDVGEHDEDIYLVMEFIRGAPLDAVLGEMHEHVGEIRAGADFGRSVVRHMIRPENEPDTADEEWIADSPTWRGSWVEVTTRIGAKIAEALQHAHASDIVHRDIKPSNILIQENGEPVLIDFGLAVEGGDSTLTRVGQFTGTPQYVSPEQAQAGKAPVDHRSDLFSLGATLFESLSLGRPFRGETQYEIVGSILADEPQSLRKLERGVSQDLQAVIERTLQKQPERRYASASEFAEDLRAIAEGRPVAARPVTRFERIWRWARREPRLAAVSLIAILAVIIGTTLTALSSIEARDQARLANDGLKEIERLSDVRRLADLVREADLLWPVSPDLRMALKDWLARADEVGGRLPLHRERLESLRRRAERVATDDAPDRLALSAEGLRLLLLEERVLTLGAADPEDGRLAKDREEIRELKEQLRQRSNWTFEDLDEQWQHDVLTGLVVGIEEFLADGGPYRSVQRRLESIDFIRDTSLVDAAEAWELAIASMADPTDSRYGGLTLEPQLGLVPLSKDPESGFWEFYDVRTGERPERDENGRYRMTGDTALIWVLLPAGNATMGSLEDDPTARGNEFPRQEVPLDAFFVSKYEVTRGQWLRSMVEPGDPMSAMENLGYPFARVSWIDAERFATRLGGDLPTEAQWIYAARGGQTTRWWQGDDPQDLNGTVNLADKTIGDEVPNWVKHPDFDDGYALLAPVGTYPPNPFGLHEVTGNVWEWCRDRPAGDLKDPVRPGDGLRLSLVRQRRAIRGGGYNGDTTSCRLALRTGDFENNRAPDVGFRPVRAIQ